MVFIGYRALTADNCVITYIMFSNEIFNHALYQASGRHGQNALWNAEVEFSQEQRSALVEIYATRLKHRVI